MVDCLVFDYMFDGDIVLCEIEVCIVVVLVVYDGVVEVDVYVVFVDVDGYIVLVCVEVLLFGFGFMFV